MRRLRRKEALQDKRDRIRMGLLPPDAPKGLFASFFPSIDIVLTSSFHKVRLSNLMKVLTSDAVQDPTRVEARVRREVAMRKHQHEKMNAERKLNDEERRQKTDAKKAEEDKKGVYGAVYKYVVMMVNDSTEADRSLLESRNSKIRRISSRFARTRNR